MMLAALIRNDRGSSAVQFGIIAPMLVLLTLGLIDIGQLGLASTSIRYATSEAARFAIAHGAQSKEPTTDDAIKTFAVSRAIGVPLQTSDVTIIRDPNDNEPGSKVTVSINYTIDLFISGLMPIDPLQVNRSSKMTVF